MRTERELLIDCLERLNHLGVPYRLVGSMASNYWGNHPLRVLYELVEALFEAGCDDGSVWSSGGYVQIGFSRESESLEAAIRSAVGDIQKAGSRAAMP
jgi:hypothetical protein